MDDVSLYAHKVLSGEIVAGPHVRNACRRHFHDLEHAHERGLAWDYPAAERFFRYCKNVLRLAGGQYEGQPFVLEPPQKFIAGSLFGWKRADGTRRFRRAYLEMAKGAGKSPLLASCGLYMMTADGEARAEVYAAASKKDQAQVLFRDAVSMVSQSPALTARISSSGINPVWQLSHPESGSFFKPLANEDGQSGPRPSCGLLDEIHEMRDRLMITMIERGFKWRKQPLLLMATNSGHDKKSVCYEQHEHAVKVAAGTMTPDDDFTFVGEPLDDETFSYVCSLDKDDDPLEDDTCWPKANPLLGVTMQHEHLAAAVKQAKMLPGARNDTLRLNFCVWTESETSWMSRAAVEACLADFDPYEVHRGADVYAGLDMSMAQDLTGAGFVVETGFKDVLDKNGKLQRLPTYDAWVEGFTPQDTLKERATRDRAPYDVWVNQGFLHSIPGKMIRHDVVAARFAELNQVIDIKELAFDRYNVSRFREHLDEAGVEIKLLWHPQGGQRKAAPPEDEVEEAKKRGLKPEHPEYPQGLWMPGSLLTLEQLIFEERIRFVRNPALISACMSAVVKTDPVMGNRWLTKEKATNRIDVLIALLMAVGAATRRHGIDSRNSVYESEDFFI